jgi:hypothetical protein
MPPTLDPAKLASQSVVEHPLDPAYGTGLIGDTYSIVAFMSGAADALPAWGTTPAARDIALRTFWPSEPMFSSALYDVAGRYASFGWTLKGPPLTTAAVQRMLHTAQYGEGWVSFIMRVLIDLFTQDNGAFIEVVRAGDSPSAPPVSLNHLDSGMCYRTGIPQAPMIYYDLKGQGHRLKWYQVIPLAEFPSPRERDRGMQYCALTRCLRAAQVMREINTMKWEKASGRFEKAVHLVSGMPSRMIEDALAKHRSAADASGQMRYIQPVIIGTLDPNATVGHAQIDLASLPDGFDEDAALTWYVTNLAMAFGTDYGDFAPLRAHGIGTGTESKTSHVKSRGKGAAVFMATLQQILNFRGVMPSTVKFQFGEQDLAEEFDKLATRKERAAWLDILLKNGTITQQVARQILVDSGDMDERYLEMMGENDATGEVELSASEPPPPPNAPPIEEGEPGPNTLPTAGGANPRPTPSQMTVNDNIQNTPPTTSTKRPAVTV